MKLFTIGLVTVMAINGLLDWRASDVGTVTIVRAVETPLETMVQQDYPLVAPCELVDVYCHEEEEKTLEEIILEEFGEIGLAIAKAESGLNPKVVSYTDIMADGRAFSFGLYQINATWHSVNGLECPKAFKGKNYKAVVIDEELYQACKVALEDPMTNIEVAKKIHEKGGWKPWGAYTNGSFKKFM